MRKTLHRRVSIGLHRRNKHSTHQHGSGGDITMEKRKVLQPNEISWEPHPQLADAKVAYLLSNRDEKADLTCLLVHLPAGTQVEKHTHDNSDDIVYVVKGKGKMWIEEVGDVPMVEGTFIRIPKGVLHQPRDIEEDLVAYDVFYPFLA
jgi:quercetin dioxygenase-like cupin family protein